MRQRHPVLIALGRNVRRRRESQKLTQEALAEKADLDQTYISGIERGIRNPSVLSIVRVAKALGISSAKLMNGVDR